MSEIKKLTENDLDVLEAEINEALAPVAQKHGLKLSCFWEHLQSGGMGAAFSLDAEVIAPPSCSEKAKDFAFFLAANKLDSMYGLSWEDYGKEFIYENMKFRIVGAYGTGSCSTFITVEYEGDLYQIRPAFVAAALQKKASVAYLGELRSRMRSQASLAQISIPEANQYASIRKWEWVVNHLDKYPFKMEDFEKPVTLYGKEYTIEGFFTVRPYQSVIVMDSRDHYYKVPAYKVLHALGRLMD